MWKAVGNKPLQFYTHCKDKMPKIRNKYSQKGISRPPSQFPHSCVCERFIYSQDLSAYSVAGKYVDQSWKYIIRSQTHECGNWDWGHAIPFLERHKWDFRCSACSLITRRPFRASSTVVTPKWIFSTFTSSLKLRASHVQTAQILGGRRCRRSRRPRRNVQFYMISNRFISIFYTCNTFYRKKIKFF
jgi:hypothetical protein